MIFVILAAERNYSTEILIYSDLPHLKILVLNGNNVFVFTA